MPLPPIIGALLKKEAYPDLPDTIELGQTHISYLFFTPKYVYKIKKPVDFGFLNFTTLEKRNFFCHEEVALNKRLSPDIYIGVVAVNKKNSGFVFEGKGDAVEYAVKMKRLPSDKMMDRMLKAGSVTGTMVKRVADVIADFHKGAKTNPYISGFGRPSVIEKNTEENFTQTQNYIGRTVTKAQFDIIKKYTQDFLKARHGLLTKRAEQGFVKDCHGDIHSEHVCVTNGVYIFDCIEFNERFRYSDTAADSAFLAMDMDFYNCHDLSNTFCSEYLRASQDNDAGELLDFYKCYRAYVRGKVEGFKTGQKEAPPEERERAALKAKRYFYLAGLYATGGFRPILLLICGLTGTGKTTIANALSAETGMRVISSDIVRKELARIQPSEHRFERFGEGIYTGAFTEKTYLEMFKIGEGFLKQGVSVIMDATFQKSRYRQEAMELAKKLGAGFHIIECAAGDDITRQRLDKRAKQEGVASDGRREIYEKQKRLYEAIKEPHIQINTSLDMEKIKIMALEEIFG